MKHIGLATLAVLTLLILAGCSQQVPPVPNGPQSWGKEEPYSTLRNATIRGAASGSWVSKRHEKMDWKEIGKLSKAEQEALLQAGFDPWTGQMKQTAGLNPYKVEQLIIADGVTSGKTYDAKGKEVQLQCVISQGNGLFREEVKKEKPTIHRAFGDFFRPAAEYTELDASPVVITACAKQDAMKGWSLNHITVEKPKKKDTEGGN